MMGRSDEDRGSRDLRARLEEFNLDVLAVKEIEFDDLTPDFQEFNIWKQRLCEAEEDGDEDAVQLARRILRPHYLGEVPGNRYLTERPGFHKGNLIIYRYPEWLWDEETIARYQPKHCRCLTGAAEWCLHPFCPTA